MRRGELIFNIALLLSPVVLSAMSLAVIGLAIAMPYPFYWVMVALMALGLFLFLKAKFSTIGQGHVFSFGTKHMTRTNKVLYFCGYGLMGGGVVVFLVVVS